MLRPEPEDPQGASGSVGMNGVAVRLPGSAAAAAGEVPASAPATSICPNSVMDEAHGGRAPARKEV